MSAPLTILAVIAAVLAGAFVLAALIFLFTAIFGLVWKILRNIFRFIGHEITDALRLIGALLTVVLFAPLVVLSIVIGRWSASRHYAGAFWAECGSMGKCLYRLAIGNPARLFGLDSALEGVEQRVPQAIAAAPGRDKPSRRVGQFDGYKIVGSLQGGGSGGKLYIAEPDEIKQAGFARNGIADVSRVVIKVFSLKDGSSLPQIVRESRALDAAKKLGLVLEHELTGERFFYVMRYVPGEALSTITQRLHAGGQADGLADEQLGTVMAYGCDLLGALSAYHGAGLWHKDVKPDNIIVDGNDGRAHLVDFGLITPLRSAMTLTTHGTEYFRDPELVRQALRGVKVHQIDGSKFDVYGAGAVLYSVIENSFPAHGGLSQITKRCPEALRWIVRRAMTDYDNRYASSDEMLADLRTVSLAEDPFKVKPIDLPSMSGKPVEHVAAVPTPVPPPMPPIDRGVPQPAPAPAQPGERPAGRPKLHVASWWTGGYKVEGAPAAGHGAGRGTPVPPPPPAPSRRNLVPAESRRPAHEQIKDARTRARQRRRSAQQRIAGRRRGGRAGAKKDYSNTPGAGVVFAGLLGLAVLFAGAVVGGTLLTKGSDQQASAGPVIVYSESPEFPDAPVAPGTVVTHTTHGTSVAVTPDLSGAELPDVEATVLVVSDFRAGGRIELQQRFHHGLKTLIRSGVKLTGDVPDFVANVAEFDEDASSDLLAAYLADRGAVPFDSVEISLLAMQWVRENPVDAVLILAPNPESAGWGDGQRPDEIQMLIVAEKFQTRLDWNGAPSQLIRLFDENGYTKGHRIGESWVHD